MSFILNVQRVIDLAREAVNLRGEKHQQETCKYLTVKVTGDSLVYRAECFVGLILWLLVGPEKFIKTLIPGDPYTVVEATNGTCDGYVFSDVLARLGVTVTPEARNLLDLMQRAQDDRFQGAQAGQGNRPWGEVLAYAETVVHSFDLIEQERKNADLAERERQEREDQENRVNTPENRLRWAAQSAEVQEFVKNSQPIQAIKAIRTQFNCSLKEGKDTWDALPRF